tara:strand:+ start:741 stop:974 length:234 start_codon:yes stop_codon:yes gene_type:complete
MKRTINYIIGIAIGALLILYIDSKSLTTGFKYLQAEVIDLTLDNVAYQDSIFKQNLVIDSLIIENDILKGCCEEKEL